MLIDVAVPEVVINSLSYESVNALEEGTRVIVEVGRTLRTGFVLGRAVKPLPKGVKAKHIEGVIDERRIIDADIWDLAVWCGKTGMCGTAAALKAALPMRFYTGEKIDAPAETEPSAENFRERNFYDPFDSERADFFLSELTELKCNERTLIIFPKREQAKTFFKNLPDDIKSESLLWPSDSSPKLWEAWKMIRSRKIRIVVAPPGGVFAPLMPHKIIVENEADPAYVIPYTLNLSARSLAGHRAFFLKAEFITAGRIPSLKTYRRTKPVESVTPERKNIILADIHRSKKESVNGIEGDIPLTFSLIKHTYRALLNHRNVIWILNRTGESSEVFCGNCGEVIRCCKCGGIMRSVNNGELLKCRTCGTLRELPGKCEKCGYYLFTGRRPGIEALAKIAAKYYSDVHVFADGALISDMHGLILATKGGLSLCGKINPSLVAWLDLDAELRGQEHTTRFNVFSMLWESYWSGRTRDSERKVLIQSRRSGMKVAEFLAKGWGKFIPDELKLRKEFLLPPYGYIIEIECSSITKREEITDNLTDAGIFVMDPGDEGQPLYVSSESLEAVRKIIEPEILLRNTKKNFIKITVRGE